MLISHVPEADAGERWLPTQSKAIACARAYKGTVETVKAGEDGREGMCHQLNSAEQQIAERVSGDDALPAPAEPPKPREAPPPRYSPSAIETDQIEEFIFERASVAQCERIFAALGCRFGELAKEKRNG